MINQLPTCSAEHAPVAPETAPECACTHPKGDALTCIAEQHHMSRFNAMVTFAHGDIERYPGQCTCPCHRGVAHQAPARNRNTGKNFAGKKSEVPA